MPLNLLRNSGILTGLAYMLTHYDMHVTDMDIINGMELPYLFIHVKSSYLSGLDLCIPQWLNLYLSAHGLKLIKTDVRKDQALEHLQKYRVSMLLLKTTLRQEDPYIYLGQKGKTHRFIPALPSKEGTDPKELHLTSIQLLSRLPDLFVVCNIVTQPIVRQDTVKHLLHSIDSLRELYFELMPEIDRIINHGELDLIYDRLIRPLTIGGAMMAGLRNDHTLYNRLTRLQNNYVSMQHGPMTRLRIASFIHPEIFQQCINGLQEIILDRLFELDVDEEVINQYSKKAIKRSDVTVKCYVQIQY